MGYTTNFSGEFSITPALAPEHAAFLREFASQDHRGERGFPGDYCQWEPNEAGTALRWNYGEKFYDYAEWLECLIQKHLVPWGYTANGEVMWQGAEVGDVGKLVVVDNALFIKRASFE